MTPESGGDGFAYDAFISYSRKDGALAGALEKRLERYRPPRGLTAPQRRLRVFRDEGDLTGTEYFASIDRELARSAKLILICSPRARASAFVGDEIRRFVRLRGAEHVVPVLCAGIPNNEATPETEEAKAFPDALLEVMEMPLATSWLGFDPAHDHVDRGRFEPAWYTLLANVLDLSRDDVEERTRKRRKRARAIAGAVAGAVMIALAALSAWALRERTSALRAEGIAESRLMAARALRPPRGDPLYALVHALSAMLRAPTFEAEGALVTVVEDPRVLLVARHRGPVYDALPSPDGTRFLTVSGDSTARVTDTLPGPPVELVGHRAEVRHGAWSPDGTRVLTGSDDGDARVWDARTGATSITLHHPGPVTFVAWSADGSRLVTAGADGPARLWSAEGDSLAVMGGHEGPVTHVALDPTGGLVATASESAMDPVRLWSVDTGAAVRTLHAEAMWPVSDLSFSGDGTRIVTSTAGGQILVWNAGDGALIREMRVGDGDGFLDNLEKMLKDAPAEKRVAALTSAARRLGKTLKGPLVTLDPHGDRVAIADRHSFAVEIRDVATDTLLSRMSGHRGAVEHLEFDPRGKWLVTGSDDGTARLWEPTTGAEIERYGGHERVVYTAAFTRDGRWVATASGDYTGRVWEVREATRHTAVLARTAGRLLGLAADGSRAFSPDGRFVATPSPRGVRVWETGAASVVSELPANRRTATESVFGPDGARLAVAWTQFKTLKPEIEIVDVATGRRLGDFAPPGHHWRMGFSPAPGAPSMVLVGDSSAWIVDAASGRVQFETPTIHLRDVPAVAAFRLAPAVFSPDGHLLATIAPGIADAGAPDYHADLWDLETGSRRALLDAGTHAIHTLAFSADGTRVVAAGDSAARVWDVATGNAVSPVIHHARGILSVALSPDGTHLVTGVDDFTAVVWDVVTGKVIRVLAGHVANVLSAGYRADGARIFTFAPADGTVRLWEAASGRTQVVFPGPPGDSIVGAWFHGEEGRLVLGTREGAARIFSTERCRLLAHATAMLPVNLTDSAWAAILDDVPMPARSDTKCPDPGP